MNTSAAAVDEENDERVGRSSAAGASDNRGSASSIRPRAWALDRTTILGLAALLGVLGWVAVAGAGSAARVFWCTRSLALVVGGAALTALVAHPAARLGSVGAVLKNAFFVRTRPPDQFIVTLVALADVARRHGLLALEEPAEHLQDDFLKRAMRMAVDGTDPRALEAVMQAELESMDYRHAAGAGLLRSMGMAAPAFGMIGTLIGLVVMLGHMDSPAKIGPGMAVALLTTLYGLVVANVFCLPLARRLESRSSQELLTKTIMLKGVLAIQAGDNPRIVEQKLRAYLPASANGGRSVWSLLTTPAPVERPTANRWPRPAGLRRPFAPRANAVPPAKLEVRS